MDKYEIARAVRIEDFKMLQSSDGNNTLQATFTCKDIIIRGVSTNSIQTNNNNTNNVDTSNTTTDNNTNTTVDNSTN